jgi:hypothetical protein
MGLQFRNPIVAGEELAITAIRSEDYIENVKGWRISRDGKMQVDNLQVLTNVGAGGDINAKSMHVGTDGLILSDGSDVGARLDTLETNFPQTLAWGTDANIASSALAAEIVVMELQWVQDITSTMAIFYRVMGSSNVANDQLFARLRYTTNGTVPGLASTVLDQYDMGTVSASGRWVGGSGFFVGTFTAGVTYRVLCTIVRAAGTGTISVANGNQNHAMMALRMAPSALAQSFYDRIATASPPSPPGGSQTYVKKYLATWTDSYDNANALFSSSYCWQGNNSTYSGQTKSLIGFDNAQIALDLAGAISISKLTLTYKVRQTYWSDGADFRIRWHNYSSSPATFNNANCSNPPADVTKTSQLQSSIYTHVLDNNFAGFLLSGTMKGIAIGPAPNTSLDYYGNLWGYPWTDRPYLTVTYQK